MKRTHNKNTHISTQTHEYHADTLVEATSVGSQWKTQLQE